VHCTNFAQLADKVVVGRELMALLGRQTGRVEDTPTGTTFHDLPSMVAHKAIPVMITIHLHSQYINQQIPRESC